VVSIAYHADLNEVQGNPRLAALCAAPAARTPFARADWWQGLARHCGLAPLVVESQVGNATLLLPLMRRENRLEALANWYNFNWEPVVSHPEAAPALLAALARDLARHTGRLTLAPLHAADTEILATAFAGAGWVVERAVYGHNHVLPVGGRGYAAYLASRPGALRTTLTRKSGKVAVEIHTHFADGLWAEYEAVYAASWKPNEGSPAFLRDFARAEGAAGRLRLAIARVGDEAVATQFWTVEAGTAFIHKLAHREAASVLSPGTTLTAALLAHVINHDRVALVDFGTGDEAYKRDWMEATRPLYRLDIFHPRKARWWPHIARAGLRHLAAPASRG